MNVQLFQMTYSIFKFDVPDERTNWERCGLEWEVWRHYIHEY